MKALFWGILALGVLAWPAALSGSGIEGSRHDFRSRAGEAGSTQQVCVFCHAPSDRSAAPAPLWDSSGELQEFQRFATMGSANLESRRTTVGSVSLACLSCHDGTQAADVVYNSALAAPSHSPTPAPIALFDLASRRPTGLPTATLEGGHPVSVPYAGGVCDGVTDECDPRSGKLGRKDFRTARHAVINAGDRWWVDTGGGAPGYREKTDMILYSREDGGTVGPFVECGSCHDPHEGASRPVSFLRVPNEGSRLCQSCHVK